MLPDSRRSGAPNRITLSGASEGSMLRRLIGRIAKPLDSGPRDPDQCCARIDPRGPVFVSYRQSDGTDLAVATAWALRAAGIPVWHDKSDLPPGETNRRLAEALDSGLSGAVLLVTPDIRESQVIREIELPRLLALAEHDAFTFSVLSVVEREHGKLDYGAPDRLLDQPMGTLSGLRQDPVGSPAARAAAAHSQSRRRMEAVRSAVEAAGGALTIDVQTRIPPFATRLDADLVLRLRPPLDGDRRPNHDGLHDLAAFLGDMPRLLAVAGADRAVVRGGAHLSVAYALGAAMPTTLIGTVDVLDTAGNAWTLSGNAAGQAGQNRLLEVSGVSQDSMPRGPILVYLDLLPQRSDGAFNALIADAGDRFLGAFQLRAVSSGDLAPGDAGALVGEASQIIRELSGRHGTSEVHLLLRCPWTVALLLGRAMNTVRVHLYEWEDGPDDCGNIGEPRYLPSLVVRSGAGGSPIQHVSLSGPEREHW